MIKRLLDVPPAMAAYAAAHGATFDPHIRLFFVEGEVPNELLSFVPKPVRQAIPEYGPSCPRCNAHMVRRRSKGDDFWGCSRYPRCRGTVSWEYHGTSALSAFASNDEDEQSSSEIQPCSSSSSAGLRLRWEAVVRKATFQLGSIGRAQAWLNHPKVALGWETPVQVMATSAGCDRVESLLESLLD